MASKTDPLADSGLVIVDKPQGMTSHDVVSHLRKALHTRKVGHAGTLDPMATGVLVAGINRGTKFLTHLTGSDKTYDATMCLGAATTTDDAEGDVIFTADASSLSDDDILAAIEPLRGDIMQRPASVSAIKINGQRAHQLVREGQAVDIPARPVCIMRIDVHQVHRAATTVSLDVTVECSSGTYIRSLARDLGEALGVGGHLTALRRTRVGAFTLDDAVALADLEKSPRLSLTLDEALPRYYPTLPVTDAEALDLAQGKWLGPRGLKGIHAAVAPDGRAIALVQEKGKRLSTVFVARPSTLS